MPLVSSYSDKNDFIRHQLVELFDEARRFIRAKGSEPAVQDDDAEGRLANVVVMDLMFGYSQFAQQAELRGYLAFFSSPAGQQLTISTGYATIYSKLYDSIVAELVEAGVPAAQARAQTTENIDQVTDTQLRGGRPNSLAIARLLLGDEDAKPIEDASTLPAAVSAPGGGCLMVLISMAVLTGAIALATRTRARFSRT